MTQYTRGFTNNSPTYVVFNATNGTVSLVSNKLAYFTATVTTNALGCFMFAVSDASGFSDTNTVGLHIYVANNTAPVLAAVSNQTINVGVNLNITNRATDSDVPLQTLIFSLPAGPTNATLNSSNGIFNWRPLVTQSGTTNPVTVVVTDNGTPNLSATQSFSIIVNPLTQPGIASFSWSGGLFGLSVNGQTGPDYAVQTSTNLSGWNTLFITNSPSMPFLWMDADTNAYPMRFYRIKTGPPLP